MSIISRFIKGFELTEDEQNILQGNAEHNSELETKIEQGYSVGSEKFSTTKNVRGIFKRFFHGTTNALGVTARVCKRD